MPSSRRASDFAVSTISIPVLPSAPQLAATSIRSKLPAALAAALVLLAALPLAAQTVDWTARHAGTARSTAHPGGGDSARGKRALAFDAAGNAFVTGRVSNGANDDYLTVKYDASGAPVWARTYNGTGNAGDRAYALALDGSGNVYVTGESWGSLGGWNYVTVKYDTNGNLLWTMSYNGTGNASDQAYALAIDGSGNVYVSGIARGALGGDNYATVKYDTNGTQLWAQEYNGTGNSTDRAWALALDGSGNVYVTGESWASLGGWNYATVKYTSGGTQLWAKEYDGTGSGIDSARALTVDGSGNVYVTGRAQGAAAGVNYGTVKYESGGTQLWAKEYNGTGNGNDSAYALAVDGSGNVYVTGSSMGASGGANYLTVKYDTNGIPLWVKEYNGTGNNGDSAFALAVDGGGNVYVTGYSMGASDGFNYVTVKYDTNGNPLWLEEYNGTGNGTDSAYALAVDGTGNPCVAGLARNAQGFDEFRVISYAAGDGAERWNATHSATPVVERLGSGHYFTRASAISDDDSIYLAGSIWSGTSTDFLTVKLASSGALLWAQLYDGTGNGTDEAAALVVDESGNVYVTGTSQGSAGGRNYATLAYDSGGTLQWAREFDGTASDNDWGYAIALDQTGNVYVTGSSWGATGDENSATVKYNGDGTLQWAREYNGTANGRVAS